MADRNLVLQFLITLRDQASEGMQRIGAGVDGIRNAVSAALEPLRSFGGLMAAAIGIGGAKEVIDRADAFTSLSNQLRIAAKDEADYQGSLAAVTAIAKEANSEIGSTASLYGKVKQSAADLSLSQQQVADVTTAVAKGMQLSGADAAAAAGATQQFTQALASGVLRGDEFNSVIEASPALIKAIADGLGVAVGDMRKMAEAGQLTSDRVVTALLTQKSAIDEVYGKLPQTVGQAMGQLDNAATLFIGKLNEQTSATQTLGSGLKFMAENMDLVVSVMGAGFAAAMLKGTVAMGQSVQASIAARAAARDHALAEAARQREILASAQAQVAATQAAYNRALAEQRLAQQIVTAMQAELGYGVTETELAAARTRGAAAAQAATAATQRYTAAQAALAALQGPAAASAGLFSRALGFLAGPGGLILMAVSAFGLLYSAFSKQKPVTDELAQSTEQYAESLKKMGMAQAQVELSRVNDALIEQRQRVQEAQQAYQQAANTERDWILITEDRGGILGKTTRIVSDASEIERLRAERLAQVETETQKLAAMEERRTAALAALNAKQQESTGKIGETIGALLQQVAGLDQTGARIAAYAKHVDTLSKAHLAETTALLEKAKAEKNVAEVARLTVQLAEQRAKAAKDAAELARGEATAAQLKVTALEKLYQVQGALTPQNAESLRTAREAAAAKTAEAAAAEALAAQLRNVAESERNGVAAKERMAIEAEKSVQAARNQSAAIQDVANATLSGIRADIDKAKVLGLTSVAQQKTIELAKAEAEWAKVVAAAKQAEIEAQIAANQAKMAALAAAGLQTEESKKEYAALALKNAVLGIESENLKKNAETKETAAKSAAVNTQATQANTAATAENTEATEQAAESAGNLAGVVASLIDYWRQKTAALSEATKALFEFNAGLSKINPQAGRESMGGISDEAAKASQKIGELTAFVRQMDQQMLFSTNSVGRYMDMIQRAGAMAERSYYEQKLQAEQLEEALKKIGETGGSSFASLDAAMQYVNGTAKVTQESLYLLSEQDMDQLTSAIDGANQKLREMQEEAQSAKDKLAELDAQIAEAQGDKDRADRLKLELEQQRALAEVEKKLTEARALGERELIALYEEQKRKLAELYTLKERNLDQDQRNNQNSSDRSNRSSGSTTTTTTTASSRSGGGATISPSFNFPNAIVVDRRAVEELTRQHILPVLKDIERRSR